MNAVRSLLTFAVITALPGAAIASPDAVKERQMHKTYNVVPTDELFIDNTAGNISVHTWEKNEIEVAVYVTVRNKTEEKATEIMDHVVITENTDLVKKHIIRYTSGIEPETYQVPGGMNVQINYIVNVPKSGAIRIFNKFGNVDIRDHAGSEDLDVSFGNLNMDFITGRDKRIRVSFGNAYIGSIEYGRLVLEHSRAKIDVAYDINIEGSYSPIDINSVRGLDITQKAGDLNISRAMRLDGTVSKANITIGQLTKSTKLNLSYCNKTRFNSITSGVDKIKIDANYSNLFFSFDEGTSLLLNMEMDFGNMTNRLPARRLQFIDEHTSGNTFYCKGKIGRGEGSMLVNTHYSNVSIY